MRAAGPRPGAARGTGRIVRKLWLVFIAAAALVCALPAAAAKCPVKPGMLDLGMPLPKTREAILKGKEIEIVALGSSSTEGYGATSPRMSYPAEMLRVLLANHPDVKITVYNKGIGGQDVSDMLKRLERDVFQATPDLVIWQLGTNAAMRAESVDEFRRLLAGGIDRLRAQGIEVVLMNQQFAPAVVALPNEEEYVRAIAEVAREKQVPVFPRFAIMRYWYDQEHMPYAQFISRDGLHLNDYGYRCIGSLLAQSIENAIAK